MRRRTTGLTLLEVLAAVAILGIFYTVLAGVAIRGLHAEGEAARRLEASLLADRVLTELEAAMETGAVPPVGRDERQSEDFVVSVEVAPFELVLPEPAEEPRRRGARERRKGDPGLLGPRQRGAPAPLRRIDVRVAWVEGYDERAVTRTTYAFDIAAVEADVEALGAAAPSEESDAPRTQAPSSRRRSTQHDEAAGIGDLME